jgi:hypothetical protein
MSVSFPYKEPYSRNRALSKAMLEVQHSVRCYNACNDALTLQKTVSMCVEYEGVLNSFSPKMEKVLSK